MDFADQLDMMDDDCDIQGFSMERSSEKKEYRWTWRDKSGKAYFKPMNPDCNSCDGCKWFSTCMDDLAARMAELEDRLDIT